ncbi:MAG: PQQ-dependent sugar dehydrogenase [Bacteroidia bacterium]|nr:PQQ-dependent sugar dehydrogenase [Bacteroidia bacterium]
MKPLFTFHLMMKPVFLCLIVIVFFLRGFSLFAQPTLVLEPFVNGFSQPVDIANAGDSRLFIVQRNGYIFIVDSAGNAKADPFLDIDARVMSTGGSERGLLGLAFHPQYPDSPYFYVNYINNSGDTHISRFSVTADPDSADPNSEVILLPIDQPYSNHNGGDLAFGPDGYLYAALGDGGDGGDPQNHGQTTSSLLGKILRLDVDQGTSYAIPAGNPYVNNPNVADEIWALGLRNPWRFSFDRLTGDMWIADVGQNQYEEINFQPAASSGGENYGWRCYEGNHNFNPAGCGGSSYVFPIFEYPHNNTGGCSVTGGFVYRGNTYGSLYGYYVFADYCSGRFWSVIPDINAPTGWQITNQGVLASPQTIGSFGENSKGEIFVAGTGNGIIYRLKTSCVSFFVPLTVSGDTLQAGLAAGVAFQWYQDSLAIPGANDSFYVAADSGNYYVEVTDGSGCTGRSNEVFFATTDITPEAPAISLQLSPNPGRETFSLTVQTLSPGVAEIAIYDLLGRKWQTGQTFFNAGENREVFDTRGFPAGIYLVQVRQNGHIGVVRWVREN